MPERGWKGNSKFRQKFHSPCQILIFFIAHPRNYSWFHGPSVLQMRFLGTRKSMNCQVNAISKNTVVTHLLY